MKTTKINIEIPLGKRTKSYRLFEMLPAFLSYGSFVLLILLSLLNPTFAAIFVLVIIVTLLVKSIGIANHTVRGNTKLVAAQKIDWHARLMDLENPRESFNKICEIQSHEFGIKQHINNLRTLATAKVGKYPLPSQIYNAVIIATYNESFDVLDPTVRSVIKTTFDNKKIILVIAFIVSLLI